MKTFRLVAMVAMVASGLSLVGCGGGSGSGSTTSDAVTRALLDGGGATSGTGVTTKTWRVVAISGNHNYPSSGADQTCPAKLIGTTDSSETLECGASDTVTLTSDGTFKFQGWGKTWALDGTKVTLDYGTALGTQVAEVVPQTVGGKQRLRIMQLNFTRKGTVLPHDDGAVIVLEEMAM